MKNRIKLFEIVLFILLLTITYSCSENFQKIETDNFDGEFLNEVQKKVDAVTSSTPKPDDSISSKDNILNNMILIPKGEFAMGSNKIESAENKNKRGLGTKRPMYADEFPERNVYLEDYYIDKFETSNSVYALVDMSYRYNTEKKDHPMIGVDWAEADRFCKHMGKKLPTEEMWEKAARGIDRREFPWGNDFIEKNVNYSNKGTTPVGFYELGKSPYGVYDMAGNVWEWTSSWYVKYPGSNYEIKDFGNVKKVARGGGHGGGGHYSLSSFLRSAHRLPLPPKFKGEDTGFRCVKEVN